MKWNKGRPPSKGWWPASMYRDPTMLRWWNGRVWSVAVHHKAYAVEAGRSARTAAAYQNKVEWTERPASWPARSRT